MAKGAITALRTFVKYEGFLLEQINRNKKPICSIKATKISSTMTACALITQRRKMRKRIR